MKPTKNTNEIREFKTAWLKEIVIDETLNYIDTEGEPISILGELSPINIFVGPTSTGKTRLMRKICSLTDPKVKWGGVENDLCQIKIDEICNKYPNIIKKDRFNPITKKLLETIPGAPFIDSFDRIVSCLTEHSNASSKCAPSSILLDVSQYSFSFQLQIIEDGIQHLEYKQDLSKIPELDELKKFINELRNTIEEYKKKPNKPEYFTGYSQQGVNKGERFFISSTRINLPGLYGKDRSKEQIIEKAIRKQYFPPEEDDPNIKIWTGERTYAELERFYTQGEPFDDYVEYLRKWVFNTKELELKVENDTILVSLDKGSFRCISEHGDGVMNLITLTLPFYTEAPRILFFDEPEHGLHPGHLQAFVKELINYRQGVDNGGNIERNVIVFMTTHSGELLDMLNTVEHKSFFKFKRVAEDKIQIKQINWGDSELVKELGIRPGASMLVNCTIWVEGVTDQKVFSHLVNQFISNNDLPYRESIHFAFSEYGGANIKHWSFVDDNETIDLETLCGPHIIVLDNDGVNLDDDADKAKYRKKLKEILGNRAIFTPGRELDNLYPEKHVKMKAKDWGCEDKNSKKIKTVDYLKPEVKIGKYLEDIGVTNKICTSNNDGQTSGRLKTDYKNKFAEGIEQLEFDDWHPDVQKMIEKMVVFIKEMNEHPCIVFYGSVQDFVSLIDKNYITISSLSLSNFK